MNVRCSKCGVNRNSTDFYSLSNNKWCRFCFNLYCRQRYKYNPEPQKLSVKKWRLNHPARANEFARKQRHRRQSWLNQQKSHPCLDCGIQYDPCAMQFDHRDPKIKRGQVTAIRPIEWMKAEMLKCDLVCANCHAIRTHKQQQQRRIIPCTSR